MTGRKRYWIDLVFVAALALSALIAGGCDVEEAGGGLPATSDARALPGQMQGVTDTEIRIGTLLPITGPAAPWGIPFAQGMRAYYDYINQQGGMYGRKIKLFVEDSQYSAPVATEAVRKLVEQDKVFALQGTLGSEVESAVYKYLEERGIPDMYIAAPNNEFTEPVVRTRFAVMPPYSMEGRVLARHVYQTYSGQKLGMLVQNTSDAREWEQGLKEGLEELNADVDVKTEYFDPAQSDVTAQVQRLKTAGVAVIAFVGQPVAAAGMLNTARQLLSWDVPIMLNSGNASVVGQLAGYDNIEGAVSALFYHGAWETQIPGIAEDKRLMADVAPDVPFEEMSLNGWGTSLALTVVLKQAGPDLTRESFLDAAESVCKSYGPTSLVPWSTSPTDHRGNEGSVTARAVVDRSVDPPTVRWEPFGDIVDFESTKDCVVATPPPGAENQPGPSIQDQKE
jgi:branched-chain amino acid transport system substrate-binding protein